MQDLAAPCPGKIIIDASLSFFSEVTTHSLYLLSEAFWNDLITLCRLLIP